MWAWVGWELVFKEVNLCILFCCYFGKDEKLTERVYKVYGFEFRNILSPVLAPWLDNKGLIRNGCFSAAAGHIATLPKSAEPKTGSAPESAKMVFVTFAWLSWAVQSELPAKGRADSRFRPEPQNPSLSSAVLCGALCFEGL